MSNKNEITETKPKAKNTTKYKNNIKNRFIINSIRLDVEGGKTVEIDNVVNGRITKNDKRLIKALDLKILSKV